ncbi:MAG: trypsin-like peptidase domain-containing protein [Bacteroidia bacterium]|nr:trypsin-like peptidase domain-containing protein [Bacteroidia bacterium]
MKTNFKTSTLILLFALTSGFGGAFLYQKINPAKPYYISSTQETPVRFASYNLSTPETAVDFTTAAEMSIHAVVHVKTMVRGNVPMYNDPWGFWGQGYSQERIQKGSGSGVIITDNGYIVTNNHVVQDAENVEVTLNDNRTFRAKVVGADPSTDIALLKIEEKNLPYITYGNSDDVKIGQWVLAVGNPFNLTSTVTAGIVSAKARNIGILPGNSKIESFIQTDAAVNPGNSGGALVNTQGELIGINAAIASNTGSFTGYSFAIPVNLVKKVIADMIEFGAVQRAYLGVSLREIDSKLAEEKRLKESRGAYIENVMTNSAADKAGISNGDIIVKVDNVPVNSVPLLQEQIANHRPGDKVNVTVLRDGSEKVFTTVLENKEGTTGIIKASASTVSLMGAVFENLNDNEKDKLNISGGAKIKKLAPGKLRNAGIREGFVITSIDKKPILSSDDVIDALKEKKGGILIEGVYTNGMKAYYGFGI